MNSLQLYNPAPTPRADTLHNWIEEYFSLRLAGLHKSTQYKQRLALERFEIFVANRPLTRQLMLEWQYALGKLGYGAGYYNRHLVFLRGFLRWAEKNELVPEVLRKCIVLKPEPKHPPLPLFTDDEYERIKVATKGTPYQYLAILGYRAGMTPIDGCMLRWENVDLEKLFIKASRMKMITRQPAEYEVPIIAGSDLHEVLLERAKLKTAYGNDNDNYVHPYLASFYRIPNGSRRVTEYFEDLFRRMGIKNKTFKQLRNTFCSALANTEGNMALACRMTGHSDPKTFMAYVKPDPNALRTMIMKAQAWAEKQKEKK